MDTVIDAQVIRDAVSDETTEEHKVILLPVQNRQTSTTPMPVTPARIAQLLQAGGYKGQIIERDNGSCIESSAEGWKFRVIFYYDHSSDTNPHPTSLMLTAGWALDPDDAAIITKAANIFNMRFRYLKAYVVSEEEYTYTEAEMSHYCPNGMSDDDFNAYLDLFINLRQSYVSICREVRK